MIAKIKGVTLSGINPEIIDIEVGLLGGLPSFQIVGLPDKTIDEAKERINLAVKSIGAKPPNKLGSRIVVNLSPADLKKEGSHLDLAIALAYLFVSGQLKKLPQDVLFLGELGLDGKLKKIRGVLPIVIQAIKFNYQKIVIPYENAKEVAYLDNVQIYPFKNLEEVIEFLEKGNYEPLKPQNFVKEEVYEIDLPILSEYLLRGLIISALGRHNLLLYGPPGTGKTLVAKSLVYFLPSLSYEESLEVSSIYSSLGLLEEDLIKRPPFRSPHHSSSAVAILGGGKDAKPGEVSLAHRGVLFFDELPEFRRDVLEGIREPLENGEIVVARAKKVIKYPAKFLFVGAYNPCPCGYYGDEKIECKCSLVEINRYQKKISGPLLDRIDIRLNVPRLESEKIFRPSKIDFKKIKEKILEISEKIRFRFSQEDFNYNSEIPYSKLNDYIKLGYEEEKFLKQIIDSYHLSLRSVHKILKIALTIKDWEGEEKIKIDHLAEAVQYKVTQND